MSKFEPEKFSMKLGEILKTFTNSTYAMAESAESSMASAVPIWEVLGMTEKDYYIKYAVDISGNNTTDASVPLEITDEKVTDEIVAEIVEE